MALILFGRSGFAQEADSILFSDVHDPIEYIDATLFDLTDSTITTTKENVALSLQKGDTLEAIDQLNILSQEYCNRVNFAKAYDGHWRALLLSDKVGDTNLKADSYIGLGVLYSLYEKREEAKDFYLKAMALHKANRLGGAIDSSALQGDFIRLGIHYKYDSLYHLAHNYLDSCAIYGQSDNPFYRAERAHVYVLENKLDTARAIFNSVLPLLKNRRPSYLTVLYSYLGDLEFNQGRYEESSSYYKQSIKTAYRYKSHFNYVPDNYLKLARVMGRVGKFGLELTFLKYANAINEKLYSSRSPNNKYLLEIKDEYRKAQEENELERKEQALINLRQERQISELKVVVLFSSIIFIICIGTLLFIYWRSRHKAEKRTLETIRQKEKRQSEEILKLKNSELTGSTLEVVAKDELLSQLKEKLKNLNNSRYSGDIGQLLRAIDLNKDQSWINFENRFNAVNKGFYDAIKSKYPQLKPYDLKLCSLIKLGFSGKEMARLLGISPESANTARYRLRKKLKLKNEDDLVQYINTIGNIS